MDPHLAQSLLSLGLSEKEAKLYLTLLEVGPNPVSAVARKSGVTRTTAYAAFETLKSKGLVSAIEQAGIQQFSPVPPKKLEEYAYLEQEKSKENYQKIKTLVPKLASLTGHLIIAPKVKYYEGIEGVKTIYLDSLETLKGLPKIERVKYAYSSAPEVSSELRKFLDNYIVERRKHQIRVKVIFQRTKRSLEYEMNAKKNLAEVRFLEKDISLKFESEISVYGDKVAILSLKSDRLHGVIIESPEIASTQHSIFELSWRGCRENEGL